VARRSIARRNLSRYNPFSRPPRKRLDNIKIARAPLGGGIRRHRCKLRISLDPVISRVRRAYLPSPEEYAPSTTPNSIR
jgi:hypothetical protein